MHNFNRFFLIGGLLFSFLVPEYTIYVEPTLTTELIIPQTFEESVSATTSKIDTETNYFDFNLLLQTIYIIIVGVLLFRFSKNLYNIFSRIKNNKIISYYNAKLVLVEDEIAPHTFWNYIFINKDEYHNETIEKELFTHELTHVTQNHTFDIILIELLHAIFWFNPLFIYLKKAIRLNHEFLADASVIDTYNNTITYQELLLKRSSDSKEYYLASNLNFILTKKRLLMMTKQKSGKAILLKKMSVIPLLCGLLFSLAERAEAYNNPTEIETKEKTNSELFLASVEKNGNEIKLKCYNCERWAKLAIPLNEEHIITDFGFTNKNRVSGSEYAFSIKATENDITFSGLKNTAWINLKFPLLNGKKQYLNQNGIIPYDEASVEKHLDKELKKINDLNLDFKEQKNDTLHGKLPNGETIKIWEDKDSIPKKRIVNQKKKTLTYSTKEGKRITKKFSELTPEERKMLPPPPPPMKISKNKVSTKLLKELQNTKKYAIWIDGKVAENSVLKNYKSTDFKHYSGGYIKKNARNKKFPQPYQFYLITKGNTKNYPTVRKGDQTNIPPPPKPKKKEEVYDANGEKLFFVKNENGIKYYNRFGQEVTKSGELITSEKSSSPHGAVVRKGDSTNIPPPPKRTYPKVKKGEKSNIPPPPKPTNGNYVARRTVKTKNKLSSEQIKNLFNSDNSPLKDNGEITKYYLDKKEISKEDFFSIKHTQIETLHVVKNNNSNRSIYVVSKK
ncbi:M56 family metallopeptidase [Tenacibaculum sp. ZS6-P6]|uniref:M56 family metallopeptidase n=1 Tax=Tenacibaculum sp. ZS6-P6 TaxID=3447503 RepID=UPI003F987188